MITSITLANMKGIRDPICIDLRPLTLLFGPNSAGKSTVVQSLHYAREILERHNLDPDRTALGGAAVDFGGFRSLVHNHDITRPISLTFSLDLAQVDIPTYSDANHATPADDALLSQVSTAVVEIVVSWSEQLYQPYVSSYAVKINGEPFAKITASPEKARVQIAELNFFHPLFVTKQHAEEPFSELLSLYSQLTNQPTDELTASGNLPLLDQKSAIPVLGALLKVQGPFDSTSAPSVTFVTIISQLLVGPGELLRDSLRNLRYLGPIREVPPRNYQPTLSQDESRWASGLQAWDLLYRSGSGFLDDVNSWLRREDRLNTGYSMKLRQYKELDIESPAMIALMGSNLLDSMDYVQQELRKLPTNRQLVLVEELSGLEVVPQDVGVGVSQVLPVVVAALDGSAEIIAVEQPELHIHPAIQVGLGDLFASLVQDGQRTFILETHSEHLLLRLLRRIRETGASELPPEAPPLVPEQLSVLYVEQHQNGMSVTPLRVDPTGEFIDRWPKGFFEERGEELFGCSTNWQ